jgi:asparagine synthase (glutamine-hydrolysing)
MCGFVVSLGDIDQEQVKNATNEIRYRGPDDTNYFLDTEKKIFVGHNRLSIMDPEYGKQPLVSEDKKIILAYNGEMYNQFELRKELENNNIKFKSKSSDTEVVLKGYNFWGDKLFEKIDGQFAIVIIDLNKDILLISRDKFGEKPVFYYVDNNKIIIGSELKIFKHFKNVNLTANPISLKKYFIYSFIPAPQTIYKNIYKVKHSENIKINLENYSINKRIYFKPAIIKNNQFNESKFIDELDFLISESVKSRLLSDSKIGVFLSGGLDSSLISFYAKKENANLESYSISVNEKSFDEIENAKKMSKHLDIKLHDTKLDKEKFSSNFNRIIGLLDEPIGAPTYIPMYFLSELASKNVKSVLSGDGADEIFGGYENFNYLKIFKCINFLKLNKIFSKAKNLISLFPISKKNLSLDFKLRRFSQGMEVDEIFQNTFFLSSLSLEDYEDLFREKFDFEEILDEVIQFENENKSVNYIDKNYLYFTNFYIPDLICARADKAGMLNSLEIRSPFLNSKILNLMLTIPKKKSYLLKNKIILKKLALKRFNYNFFKIKKGGFTYPMQKWLDTSDANRNKFMDKDKFLQMKSDHLNKNKELRNFFHCNKVLNNFV